MSNTRTTRTPPRARQSKPPGQTITFQGESYKVSDKFGVWPMMQFARAAEAGMSLGDAKGLAAAYSMLQDVIHEDDWGRFQENMINNKVDDLEGLMKLTQEAVALIADSAARKNGRANGRATATAEVEE
jgi:hypothetical protein